MIDQLDVNRNMFQLFANALQNGSYSGQINGFQFKWQHVAIVMLNILERDHKNANESLLNLFQTLKLMLNSSNSEPESKLSYAIITLLVCTTGVLHVERNGNSELSGQAVQKLIKLSLEVFTNHLTNCGSIGEHWSEKINDIINGYESAAVGKVHEVYKLARSKCTELLLNLLGDADTSSPSLYSKVMELLCTSNNEGIINTNQEIFSEIKQLAQLHDQQKPRQVEPQQEATQTLGQALYTLNVKQEDAQNVAQSQGFIVQQQPSIAAPSQVIVVESQGVGQASALQQVEQEQRRGRKRNRSEALNEEKIVSDEDLRNRVEKIQNMMGMVVNGISQPQSILQPQIQCIDPDSGNRVPSYQKRKQDQARANNKQHAHVQLGSQPTDQAQDASYQQDQKIQPHPVSFVSNLLSNGGSQPCVDLTQQGGAEKQGAANGQGGAEAENNEGGLLQQIQSMIQVQFDQFLHNQFGSVEVDNSGGSSGQVVLNGSSALPLQLAQTQQQMQFSANSVPVHNQNGQPVVNSDVMMQQPMVGGGNINMQTSSQPQGIAQAQGADGNFQDLWETQAQRQSGGGRVYVKGERRSRLAFTELETKTLLQGVRKYGESNWVGICSTYPQVFGGRRIPDDLKNKWRNLQKRFKKQNGTAQGQGISQSGNGQGIGVIQSEQVVHVPQGYVLQMEAVGQGGGISGGEVQTSAVLLDGGHYNGDQQAQSGLQQAQNVDQQALNVDQQVQNGGQQAQNVDQQALNGALLAQIVDQQALNGQQQAQIVDQQALNVDQQALNVDQQVLNVDQQALSVDQQAQNVDQQAQNVDQQALNVDQQALNVDQQALNVDQQALNGEQQVQNEGQQVYIDKQQLCNGDQQQLYIGDIQAEQVGNGIVQGDGGIISENQAAISSGVNVVKHAEHGVDVQHDGVPPVIDDIPRPPSEINIQG